MAEEALPSDEGIEDFPDDIRKDVDGLIWLGHLETEVEYCGHSFVLRTLKADEELQASLLAKEYNDTMGSAKAWAWANVSQAITAIDDDDEWLAQAGPSRKDYAKQKFNYVTSNWYWHVGDYLFREYLQLVQRQLQAVDKIRDLSVSGPAASTPSASFSTAQDDSENQAEIKALMEDDSTDSNT